MDQKPFYDHLLGVPDADPQLGGGHPMDIGHSRSFANRHTQRLVSILMQPKEEAIEEAKEEEAKEEEAKNEAEEEAEKDAEEEANKEANINIHQHETAISTSSRHHVSANIKYPPA